MAVAYFSWHGYFEKAQDVPQEFKKILATARKIRMLSKSYYPTDKVLEILMFFDKVLVERFLWIYEAVATRETKDGGLAVLGVYNHPDYPFGLLVNYQEFQGIVEAEWVRFPLRKLERPEEFKQYQAHQYHGALI